MYYISYMSSLYHKSYSLSTGNFDNIAVKRTEFTALKRAVNMMVPKIPITKSNFFL